MEMASLPLLDSTIAVSTAITHHTDRSKGRIMLHCFARKCTKRENFVWASVLQQDLDKSTCTTRTTLKISTPAVADLVVHARKEFIVIVATERFEGLGENLCGVKGCDL